MKFGLPVSSIELDVLPWIGRQFFLLKAGYRFFQCRFQQPSDYQNRSYFTLVKWG